MEADFIDYKKQEFNEKVVYEIQEKILNMDDEAVFYYNNKHVHDIWDEYVNDKTTEKFGTFIKIIFNNNKKEFELFMMIENAEITGIYVN